MGELLKSVPVMPGKNEMDQIKLMFKLLGAPNERIWPGATDANAVFRRCVPAPTPIGPLDMRLPTFSCDRLLKAPSIWGTGC